MDLQKILTARSLHQIKHLQKIIDAHKTKAASIKLRQEWLDKQKVNNQINEYERIRGIIDHNLVKGKSVEGSKNRIGDINKDMKKLGFKPFEIV